jgi:nucleotide-binding universal stress UspA family protein
MSWRAASVAAAATAASRGRETHAVRYLVVPDQEDDLGPLVATVRGLADGHPGSTFWLLVPLGHDSHDPLALAEAHRHAEGHLAEAQRLLGAVGIVADGAVASDRLMWSVEEALAGSEFDCIVLSTPPTATRSLVGLDIAAHLERTFKLPVVHVVVPTARWPQPPPLRG